MLNIALKLAKKRNIPIIVYNSEDYYFKDRKSISLFYHYYRNQYKKQVRRILSYASHSIYISDMLQQTYQEKFEHQSTVIMTSTNLIPLKDKKINIPQIVSYIGNLGVGRDESLIEVAEILHDLEPQTYLDIYGKAPSEKIENALQSCSGIRMKGYVSYEEVTNVMQSSDLLVHVENFSEFYQNDL
jgi:glycosyltransferase involved in cell wall biosynthesis